MVLECLYISPIFTSAVNNRNEKYTLLIRYKKKLHKKEYILWVLSVDSIGVLGCPCLGFYRERYDAGIMVIWPLCMYLLTIKYPSDYLNTVRHEFGMIVGNIEIK